LNCLISLNLSQFLKVRATDVPEFSSWLQRTKYKWISHEIINELLEMIASEIIRVITAKIKKVKYFSIMLDETSDISVSEQVSLCVRSVDRETFQIEEYFLGFYVTDKTDSKTLFKGVCDMLTRLDLPINDLRGQCFYGASNVSGVYNGLQAKIRGIESRALFVHCQGHLLNFVT
ncbi:unnamed protein product, partial [Rotaria magnacalcarata]